ncbi:hypothetical protein HMPREF1051_2655 [Neisseria sicca VK64]|uniref:Uncharacterized protein n=1 Tax=Neisseria sicca VK64 TaxID=1095748 RepID=I2NHG5_NEISI|nr:hypothetical protein HMPREF1051_2655 [Neisseria sicca VK64]
MFRGSRQVCFWGCWVSWECEKGRLKTILRFQTTFEFV